MNRCPEKLWRDCSSRRGRCPSLECRESHFWSGAICTTLEDYARYLGANERGIAEIRTRQGLKQEAVGLPGGRAYDQGELSLRWRGLRSQRSDRIPQLPLLAMPQGARRGICV